MEDAKLIIESLNAADLKSILKTFKKPYHGRTAILRTRVMRLVDSNAVNEEAFSVFAVLSKYLNSTPSIYNGAKKAAPRRKRSGTACGVEIMEIQRTPVHPDVHFRQLPFYERLDELIKPTALKNMSSYTDRNIFVFHLTPSQAFNIANSKKWDKFLVQIQIRVGLLETTSPQDDNFPPNLEIRVNHTLCRELHDVGNASCRGFPIDITDLSFIDASKTNSINVRFSPHYQKFVIAAYLVLVYSWDNLLAKLKAKGPRVALYTQGMIQQKLKADVDNEIATTYLRVQLVCPLGKKRLVTPCRATTCDHVQCFDASIYLQLNAQSSKWICPVCNKPALFDDLVIDEYFLKVLESDRLSSHCTEIQLTSDGGWLPMGNAVPELVKPSSSKSCKAVNVLSSEDECEVLEERVGVQPPVRRPRQPNYETIELSSSSSCSSPMRSAGSETIRKRKANDSVGMAVIDLSSDTDSFSSQSESSSIETCSLSDSFLRSTRRKKRFRRKESEENYSGRKEINNDQLVKQFHCLTSSSDDESTQKAVYAINTEKSSSTTLVLEKRPNYERETSNVPQDIEYLPEMVQHQQTSTELAATILDLIITKVIKDKENIKVKRTVMIDSAADVRNYSLDAGLPSKVLEKRSKPFRPSILLRAKPAASVKPPECEKSKEEHVSEVVNYLQPNSAGFLLAEEVEVPSVCEFDDLWDAKKMQNPHTSSKQFYWCPIEDWVMDRTPPPPLPLPLPERPPSVKSTREILRPELTRPAILRKSREKK